jgi:hypothetical protein
LIRQRAEKYFTELEKAFIKQVCLKLENAPRDLGREANDGIGEDDITSKLEQRIIELAKYVVVTRSETNYIEGHLDKTPIKVLDFKYDYETRLAAAKMLNEKTGSFKGWAEDAKSELNGQLKKEVNESLLIDHINDFKPTLLSRPLREWFQQQQDILQLLPIVSK